MKRLFAVLFALICLPLAAAAQSVPQALKEAIVSTHPAPFGVMSEAEFDAQIDGLDQTWPALRESGDAGFALRALVASLGDEHTTVYEEDAQDAVLPLFVMKIGGEFLIVQVQQSYAAWAGWALEAIGDVPIGEIVERMTPYLCAETESWRNVLAAEEMISARMLVQIGAAQSMDAVILTVRDTQTGETQTAEVYTLTEGYDYSTSVLMPMAMTFGQSGYYYATLLEGGELFIQYNICADNPQMSMADFAAALASQVGANPPAKVIVDLRHNGGGDSEVINPLLDVLAQFQENGSALFVLIGAETFSSGVLDAIKLQEQGAVLVGEATGGVLGFGELVALELGEGFTLYCSSKDFSGGQAHLPLEPQIAAAQSIPDMFAGVDTVVELVRGL